MIRRRVSGVFCLLQLCAVFFVSNVAAQPCDVDNDQDIDRDDVGQISIARNTFTDDPNDPRDPNGDGYISVNDARFCVLQCTLSRCAIVDQDDVDNDQDGFTENDNDCDDSNSLINPDATDIAGNGIDENCDGQDAIDPLDIDDDLDGFTENQGDCDDNNAAINRDATEIPGNGIDENCDGIDPPADFPEINVFPNPIDFGEVLIGNSATQSITIENTGTANLLISSITSTNGSFDVFLPIPDSIAPDDFATVVIVFTPSLPGSVNGFISIDSNVENINPVDVQVLGTGIEQSLLQFPDIDSVPLIDFGIVEEDITVEKILVVENKGDAPLVVSELSVNDGAYSVTTIPGDLLPVTIDPDESGNLIVTFTPPLGNPGMTIDAMVTITSNDSDEPQHPVALTGKSTEPQPVVINNPVVGALVDDVITQDNCSDVSGQVQFMSTSSGNDSFSVTLTDQGGTSITSDIFGSPEGSGTTAFNAIDACGLSDGVIDVSVVVNLEGSDLPSFIGTPAVKNTSGLEPPVLDLLAPIVSADIIEVCGTSRANTTVRIEGGAIPASITLDAFTTEFCVDLVLKQNAQNLLIASAIDDLATDPKSIAYAQPVSVINLDPSEIIIANVFARPLTTEEITDLVDRGVIDLNDPDNFNYSMFNITLTIGGHPVTIQQPIAVPKAPGVSFSGTGSTWFTSFTGGSSSGGGGGSSGGGSGGGSGGSGGGSTSTFSVGGCTSSCSQLFVINPGEGRQAIPGVIIIDGRIKTLKEFFQVSIVLFNASNDFVLKDMLTEIVLPAGLSPVRAGPGTDVSTINTDSAVDKVNIGTIAPNSSGTGQFIIRGDAMGDYNVSVDFAGFITEGGLPEPVPVTGSAGTSLRVLGPPKLGVVVRHPSNSSGPDVSLNEIYDLIVEISNESSRPALYTGLELFIGGGARLVDEANSPLPDSNSIRNIGTLDPGATASLAYRVESLLEGEIIACQAVASENITLSIDTGPDGSACSVNNMIPATLKLLPADQAPTIIAINPLNGEPDVPVTTSIVSIFTPESSCLTADTWQNVITAPIDGDPRNGLVIVSADLESTGTYYLEELDAFGEPVKHIPMDLLAVDPPAGGTTVATLRLGLPTPLSQTFLKPDTQYRVSLIGGVNGICSTTSGAEMPQTMQWLFSTSEDCSIPGDLNLNSIQPANGSIDIALNHPITLLFNDRIETGSFKFVPGDLTNSTFGIYQNALDSGGELISEGTPVPGSGAFSNFNKTFTYTPIGNLPDSSQIHIRLTQGVRDVCGKPLQTSTTNGVSLNSFQTVGPDANAPAAPAINPIPGITTQLQIQMSGTAEPLSTVTITGGASSVNTQVTVSGLFRLVVPLTENALNVLQVQAVDASGNASISIGVDKNGDPLEIISDTIPPIVTDVVPADSEVGVSIVTPVIISFDEFIDPGTISGITLGQAGSSISGIVTVLNNMVTFTPDIPLIFDTVYTIQVASNAAADLAGNQLATGFSSTFTTRPVNLAPNAVIQTAGTAFEQDTVILDGGASNDSDGDTLSYQWSLAVPVGSLAELSDSNSVAPVFVADVAGNYEIQLIVNDGTVNSAPELAVVSVVPHPAPTLTSSTPVSGIRGSTFTVTFTGTDLSSANSVISDSPSISGSIQSATNTSVVASISIAADAILEATTLGVTTLGGDATLSFDIVEAPQIDSIDPTVLITGSTINAVIQGQALTDVTSVSISGSGVTITDLGTGDFNRRDIQFVVSPTAVLGVRTVSMTTPGGTATSTIEVTDENITVQWITPGGGNWNVAANWSTNQVPNANDNVLIATTGGVGITGAHTVNSLVTHSNVTLSGSLNIAGVGVTQGLLVNSGAMVVANTGSVLELASDIIVNGSIKINQTSCCSSLTRLRLDGNRTIGGTGEIELTHLSRSFIESVNGFMRFGPQLHITGSGYLTGVIDNGGGILRINENGGTVRTISSTTLQNLILGETSVLPAWGGTIGEGVVIEGKLVVQQGNILTIGFDTVINGSIKVNQTSCCSSITRLRLDGGRTISGTGKIELTHLSRSLIESVNGSMHFGPQLHITGSGYLTGVIDNGGGILRINENGGTVRTIASTTLQNLILADTSVLPAWGGVIGAGVIIEGRMLVQQGNILTIGSDTVINGSIRVNQTSCCSSITRLQVDGDHTIGGTGEIILTHSSRSIFEPVNNGTLTIADGFTVSGFGLFGSSQGNLIILGALNPNVQNGVLGLRGQLDNGGSPLLINSGAGSVRVKSGANLQNLTLGSTSILQAEGGALDSNVIIDGSLVITNGGLVTITQDLTVNGTIKINQTSCCSSLTRLRIDGNRTIGGTGEIELTHLSRAFIEAVNGFMRFGPQLHITGSGYLTGVIDNGGGILRINENGGTVRTITSTTLQNLTLGDTSVLPAWGGVIGAGVIIEGQMLIQQGNILTIGSDTVINGSIRVNQTSCCSSITRLQVDGDHTLGGTGEIILTHSSRSIFESINNSTLSIGNGLTVHGAGIAGGAGGNIINNGSIISDVSTLAISPIGFDNFGLLKANSARSLTISNFNTNAGEVYIATGGVVTVNGNYTQTSTASLVTEIGGTAASQLGRLNITGNASLSGTLDVQLVNGFVPALNNVFQFMSYAAATGAFDTTLGLDVSDQVVLSLDNSNPLRSNLVATAK